MNALDLANHSRRVVEDVRRKSYPISELIPHLNATAEMLRELYAENEKLKAELKARA